MVVSQTDNAFPPKAKAPAVIPSGSKQAGEDSFPYVAASLTERRHGTPNPELKMRRFRAATSRSCPAAYSRSGDRASWSTLILTTASAFEALPAEGRAALLRFLSSL
jgi:hypothetical protein